MRGPGAEVRLALSGHQRASSGSINRNIAAARHDTAGAPENIRALSSGHQRGSCIRTASNPAKKSCTHPEGVTCVE
jgi:hypothetical protein